MKWEMKSIAVSAGRILVVDDEPMVCEMFEAVLSQAGHSVTTAQSGAQALRLLEMEPFDLVITDYQMPEMNGSELALQIKWEHPGQRIMMITGIADILAKTGAFPIGLEACLSKPVQVAKLRQTVDDILARER